jgi:hypothetical protein
MSDINNHKVLCFGEVLCEHSLQLIRRLIQITA